MEVPFETIRRDLDVTFEKVYQDSGVLLRYARSDCQPHANSHTFYLNYEGPLAGHDLLELLSGYGLEATPKLRVHETVFR